MLSKVDRLVGRIEMAAAGTIIAAICCTVLLQVLFRYLFHSPLAWTEELARYLQVWLTTIGAAMGVRMGMHFKLDVIHLAIPKHALHYYRAIILLASLLFIGMLAYYGSVMLETVQRQQSPAMSVSMFYPYLALPVGAGLMGFHVIVQLLQILRGEDRAVDEGSR
jgi:TRAP-type C4-dicarboxylate transport system permease small subunit